jgi:hypothetical protein
LRKLIMMAAVLALVMAAAVPALAQVGLESGNESESEEFAADFSVTNEGDYANQCVPAMQFGNTGNFNNAPTFLQYSSESGDFEPGGIEVAFEPEMDVNCENTIQQSSAASSTPTSSTPPAPKPRKY